MKRILAGIATAVALVGVLLLPTTVDAGTYYRVYVSRVSENLYQTPQGVYILTNLCLEYAYGEEAILNMYGPYGGELIFMNSRGRKCDVVRLLRPI